MSDAERIPIERPELTPRTATEAMLASREEFVLGIAERLDNWRASVDSRLDAIEKRLARKKRTFKKPEEGYSAGFLKFMAIYPRQESRVPAYRRWKQHQCEKETERICLAATDYAEFVKNRKRDLVKLPETWINQHCWEDDFKKLQGNGIEKGNF